MQIDHRFTRKFTLCIAAILIHVPVSYAMWMSLPHKELVQQSELIVTGTILGRDIIQPTSVEPALMLVTLKIDKVIKGDKNKQVVYLRLPNRPHGLVASDDIPLQDGQKGLWYLRRVARGLYTVDRPDRYVPPSQINKHLSDLKKLGL